MAVPAHDERDHAFALRYGLPIRQVIAPSDAREVDVNQAAYVEKEGIRTVNSGQFDGLDYTDAFERITAYVEERGIGARRVNYRLRDWGVSRQRYWGCPIPVIHCETCGIVPVPTADLPVILPEDVTFMGVQSPLKAETDWYRTECPQCQGPAERETDTFDTFVESSWYYARYCSPDADAMLDDRANYWLPMDYYIGGIEHAVLHLLYFRFWHKLMRDAGIVTSDEPATNLLCQGMVLAEAYYLDTADGGRQWVPPDEVEVERDGRGNVIEARRCNDASKLMAVGWTTMSKSKNNGVDPQRLIDRYGADTVRVFTMFASPPDQSLEWNDSAVAGSLRFLRRLWALVGRHSAAVVDSIIDTGFAQADEETIILRRQVHTTLVRINRDMQRNQFNTVVAACMEMVNALDRFDTADKPMRVAAMHESLGILVRVLAPIAPHITHALWEALAMTGDLLNAPWPESDAQALQTDQITLVVQVNGKLRGQIEVAAGASDEDIRNLALSQDQIAKHTNGRPLRKVIIVPGKLVNIVA
jgi:leucyl-tRNA synthetase